MKPELITEIFAQIVSFSALAFSVISYFVSKKNYLFFQALCMVGLVLSFLLKSNFFAMVGMTIGICRAVTFFLYEKCDKDAPIALSFLFGGLSVAAYLIINVWIQGVGKYEDIFYLLSLISYAFSFRIRDRRTLLYVTLLPTSCGVIYSVISYTTLFVFLLYAFEFSANVVAIGKLHIENRRRTLK